MVDTTHLLKQKPSKNRLVHRHSAGCQTAPSFCSAAVWTGSALPGEAAAAAAGGEKDSEPLTKPGLEPGAGNGPNNDSLPALTAEPRGWCERIMGSNMEVFTERERTSLVLSLISPLKS